MNLVPLLYRLEASRQEHVIDRRSQDPRPSVDLTEFYGVQPCPHERHFSGLARLVMKDPRRRRKEGDDISMEEARCDLGIVPSHSGLWTPYQWQQFVCSVRLDAILQRSLV